MSQTGVAFFFRFSGIYWTSTRKPGTIALSLQQWVEGRWLYKRLWCVAIRALLGLRLCEGWLWTMAVEVPENDGNAMAVD